MTRYFFPASRAHHAYCMARDFGMEFEQRFGKWPVESLPHIDPGSNYRLYVHPDSLHLLEPVVRDVIKQWGSLAGVPIYDIGERNGKPCYFMPDGSFNHFDSCEKIIQRNGIAFHWPESEEV